MNSTTMNYASLIVPAAKSTMNRTIRVLMLMAFVIALFLFIPPLAFAQSESESASESRTKTTTTTTTTTSNSASTSANSKTPKKTTVNFEDQLIEGQTQKPELFYLLQQRSNNFKRLIKLRENFLPEMRDTAEDISSHARRHGSGQ